jgi:hypothetical protein
LANPRHHVYHRAQVSVFISRILTFRAICWQHYRKRVWAQKPLSNPQESPTTTAIKKENAD